MLVFMLVHGSSKDKLSDSAEKEMNSKPSITYEEPTSPPKEPKTEKPTEPPTTEPVTEEAATLNDNEIRPEIKAAIDSYEEFMNEYIEFMDKYENASTSETLELMGDYFEMLERYTRAMEEFEKMEEAELTTAEALYYTEVNLRVAGKLSKYLITNS